MIFCFWPLLSPLTIVFLENTRKAQHSFESIMKSPIDPEPVGQLSNSEILENLVFLAVEEKGNIVALLL